MIQFIIVHVVVLAGEPDSFINLSMLVITKAFSIKDFWDADAVYTDNSDAAAEILSIFVSICHLTAGLRRFRKSAG